MRPTRRYYFVFTHPPTHVVKLMALGETPCRAKNSAFETLERLLKVDEALPREGWTLALQEDHGIVG